MYVVHALHCMWKVAHIHKQFSELFMMKHYTIDIILALGKFIFNVSGSILSSEVLSCVLYNNIQIECPNN